MGDGVDIIYDKGGNDTLQFNGINEEDIEIQKSNSDLVIGIKETGIAFSELSNKIVIKDFMKLENQIETIVFQDGTLLDIELTLQNLLTSEDSDYIDLSNSTSFLNIDLKAGNDIILTGNNDDVLIGNLGDDLLQGGKGNDTYIFNIGDGKDTILDTYGVDIINFGENITSSDLIVKVIDSDIIVALREDGVIFDNLSDKITISNINETTVQTIKLNDGTSLNIESFQEISTENDNLYFTQKDISLDALEGDDIITTSNGKDSISGNAGNDIVFTGANDDILKGGSGDDTLQGGLGDDTYIFNSGDGNDIVDDSFRYGYKNRHSRNAGNDTLLLGQGITKDSLEVRLNGDDITLAIKEDGKTFEEYSDSITIKNWLNTNSKIENILLSDGTNIVLKELQSVTEGDDTLAYDNNDVIVDSLGGNDTIITGSGNDIITTGLGNDTIKSDSGDDIIYAGDGNDVIDSGEGNDIVDSGKGDDDVQGALGDDTYIFNLGDGVDTIYDYYRYGSAGNDTIKFGENVTLDDLSAIANGNDLTISYSDIDKIIVKGYFNSKSKIENILLNDGTSLSLEQIQKATFNDDELVFDDNSVNVDSLAGNDTITTGSGDDIINSNSGNDIINSNNGLDNVDGGLGNDSIYTGDGNDIIQGNQGADYLEGGLGNDTYIFNLGDGVDTIYDNFKDRYSQKNAGNDTLLLGEGISQELLIAKTSGDDLIVAIKENGKAFDELSDKIIIKDWANVNNRVETLQLFDGSLVTFDSIQAGSSSDDTLLFGDNGVNINSFEGNDTIITGNGNDTLTGGLGSDILEAGLGNDNYIFNKGDGKDYITDIGGTDTLKFGEGITNDDLIIKRDNDNLIIAINEPNVAYENLADIITIKDWFKATNNIETIEFNDTTILTSTEIADYFVEDKLSSYLYSKIGATLLGETGNDTYVYNKGDFTVIIDDSKKESDIDVPAGYDKLILNGGINSEDISIGINGNNLVINITGSETTYEELRDRVVVKDWQDINKGIEEIIFSNGEILKIDKTTIYPEVNYSDAWNLNNNYVLGNENNNYTGSSIDETIYAGEGDDTIISSSGNDTLVGEKGNDTLEAGLGDDTYVYSLGDGIDTIFDYYNTDDAGNDTILFKDNLTLEDLIFVQKDNDLIIAIKENGKTFDNLSDKLIITNWNDSYNKIENIEFYDGSKVSKEEVLSLMTASDDDIITTTTKTNQILYGKEGNDTITTSTGDDVIYGGEGNDTINSSAGNNIIYGEAGDDNITTAFEDDTIDAGIGNDTIDSGYGNDILTGGRGEDFLKGGQDNDTYIFNKGDGQDIIYDLAGNDKLLFGPNITKDDLIFEKNNESLSILIKEENVSNENLTDKITFNNWFYSTNNLEEIHFDDGSVLLSKDIAKTFSTDSSDIIGTKPYAIVSGEGGDDYYIYNKGDKTVTINDNATISGIEIDAGNDTLVFSSGITKEDVTFGINGTDLIINIQDDTTTEDLIDRVVVKDWQNENRGIEQIIFRESGEEFEINKNETFPELNFNSSWITKKHYIYGEENNSISLYVGDSTIETNGGDDVIKSGRYNSTLDSGTGNDILYGGRGDDTYIFKRGYGQDTIIDAYVYGTNAIPSFSYNAGADIIEFKDLNISDLIFMQNNMDLIVGIKEEGKTFEELSDKLTIKYWNNSYCSIETFKFSDGSTFNQEDIRDIMLTFNNDTISTSNGNDILFGGEGDDILKGYRGNDTYIFRNGDGVDNIQDSSGIDTIKFTEGITLENLIVKSKDGNMIIGIKEDGKTFDELSNKIIIGNWINSTINNIQFNDGTTSDVESLQTITSGDDYLIYSHTNTLIDALEGDDTIITGNDNNVLKGSEGNDTLQGGSGSDRYIFNLGDGIDTLIDSSGTDTILLGDNITINDLEVKVINGDMILGILELGETFDTLSNKIIIKDWINSSINTVQFIDGTTSNIDTLQTATSNDDYLIYSDNDIVVDALEGNDNIITGRGDDIINGNDGYDTISSGSGNDILIGGNGNDILYGEFGNDTLNGGYGDDILEGAYGDDTYIFEKGFGKDTIKDEYGYSYYGDFNSSNAGNDTIKFSDNTTIDDLLFKRNGSDLIIAIKEDGKTFEELSDQLTITNWSDNNYKVENIKFSDGTILTFTDDLANYEITSSTENTTPPIVLDMNLNGTTSISLENSSAYFDYAADGQREHTSWIEEGDALLVADLNNDGIINDGNELFGDYTKLPDGTLATDGYNALAQYDTNNDSIIDYKDDNFSKLSLWSDSNLNGKTDKGELQNIQLSKVTAVHLTNSENTVFEQVTENGNLVTNETIYETNFENGVVRDIWFEYDESNFITNNDTLQASNTQRYLSLEDGNDTYLYSLGDSSVTIDDNGNGNDTIKFSQNITKEQLEVKWDKNSDDLIIYVRASSFDNSAITEIDDQILIKNWFNDSGSIETVLFEDGSSLNKEELYNLLISKKEDSSIVAKVLDENGELEGGNYNDILYGTTGSELLDGKDGHDYLKGQEGNDQLIGGLGDDTHFAGKGDDLSEDISGDEYYLYNRGDGRDTIIDANGNDSIIFGQNITIDDLSIEFDINNLIIGLKENGKTINELNDSITIENYIIDDYKIETLEFSNGQVVNLEEYINTENNRIVLDDITINLQEDNSISSSLEIIGNTSGLQFTIESTLENSSLIIDKLGNYTYTPNNNYNGLDVILVSVTNEYGSNSTATLTFNVEAVNDSPIANEDNISIGENGILTIDASDILSNDIDIDLNDILTITNVTLEGTKGVASLDINGNVVFETRSDFDYLLKGESEEVILNYEIQDSKGLKSTSRINVTILGEDEGLNKVTTKIATLGNITNINESTSSIDFWHLSHGGGKLEIDILSEYSGLSEKYIDLNNDGVQTALDSVIYLYKDIGTFNDESLVAFNDDHGNIDDGSLAGEDSYLKVDGLDSGDYILAVSAYGINHDTIQNQLNTNISGKYNKGSYQVTIFSEKGVQVKEDSNVITKTIINSGEIEQLDELSSSTSVDYWKFKHDGGSLKVDILSESSGETDEFIDLNKDNVQTALDSYVYLFKNTGSLDENSLVSKNDDHGNISDGSLSGVDSYLDMENLEKGEYVLVIGNFGLNEDFIRNGINTSNDNKGSYEITLSSQKGISNIESIDNSNYIFGLGDGNNTIYDKFDSEKDNIIFGEGINSDDILFNWKNDNLVINYSEEDSIVVKSQKDDTHSIEEFKLSNGSYLTSSDVENLIQNMIAFADENSIDLTNENEVRNNTELMNIVSNSWNSAI